MTTTNQQLTMFQYCFFLLLGSSAGGQTVQRWALLSNSPAWKTMNIRAVVANPRSYAYLDDRRWFFASDSIENVNSDESNNYDTNSSSNNNGSSNSSYNVNEVHSQKINPTTATSTGHIKYKSRVFRRPNPKDGIDEHCPWYNDWLWGLGDGGREELPCPYRDRAVAEIGSAPAIAKRYASRNVVSAIRCGVLVDVLLTSRKCMLHANYKIQIKIAILILNV